jgi:hypothetical protein
MELVNLVWIIPIIFGVLQIIIEAHDDYKNAKAFKRSKFLRHLSGDEDTWTYKNSRNT